MARIALFVVLFLWSYFCLYGASNHPVWRWSVILGWPIGLWLLVLVHELGHALAAWVAGWRVVAFAAGPFGFHLFNREFAFVPRSKRTEFEGFVMPLPSRPEVWTLGRDMLICAGGPSANLVLAMALFAAWWITRGPVPEESIDYSLVALAGAIGSLCIGVGALMPAEEGQTGTDGDQLRAAMRSSQAEWERNRAITYLRALPHYQLRLRDLPRWIVNEASEVAAREGGAFQQLQDTILIGMILDSAPVDMLEVRQMLDDYRRRYGPSEWLDSCDAYFTAIWEGDAGKARSLLWRGDSHPELGALSAAAEAAVLAREGDGNAARALIEQMHAANRARSIFPDHTFRDIGGQIEFVCLTRAENSPRSP